MLLDELELELELEESELELELELELESGLLVFLALRGCWF